MRVPEFRYDVITYQTCFWCGGELTIVRDTLTDGRDIEYAYCQQCDPDEPEET